MSTRIRVFFILLLPAVSALHAAGGDYGRWAAWRQSMAKDSRVARYYTFEGVVDGKSRVADRKGSVNALGYMPFHKGGNIINDLGVIEGRVPGKSAVRLDRGWYQAAPWDIEGKEFTLSLWFRRQGPGSLSAASGIEEGRIISVAGWERGWCVATVYDKVNTLRFCLGKPGGCVKVMSDISIPDNVWHHLAVTWNGREMLIYFNGILAGKREYSGRYVPSREGDFLRIGCGGEDTGSVVLDIDEVVIYSGALSGSEIRSLGRKLSSLAGSIFAKADKHIAAGDYASARKEYGKLRETEGVEYGRELAMFNMAESYRKEKDYASAHKTYGQILSLPDLTLYYRVYGMFMQAGVYQEQGDYESARRVYEKISGTEGISGSQGFRAALYAGDAYRKQGLYGRARGIYERLLRQEDASPYPDENSRLEVVDRLEALEGLADGQEEKSPRQKRVERVKSPKYGIYVSLQGNDDNPGTRERPFATVKRAQAEVRKVKEKGLPEGGIAVYLRGGKYFLKESIIFGREDSGTEGSPVVYRSYPGEEARLIGGRQVRGFVAVSDPAVTRRLPEESRGRVFVCDLRKEGIEDYGCLRNRGASRPGNPGAMELFYNARPMELSRWPDEGWERVAGLVTPGGDGGSGEYAFQNGRFRYEGRRPERWKEEKDIWTAGYFNWPWDKVHTRVIHLDTESRIANLAPDIRCVPGYPAYSVPVRKGVPYYFYNMLSEISVPGEYYVDRDAGRLYFYPPDKIEGSEIIVSTLDAPIMVMEESENMVIFGLTFEATWHNAIEMKGGRDNLIAGSLIRNTGQYAVNIDGGWRNGVVGCDIYGTGEGGVILQGGSWFSLIPGGHYVENNHICGFNRFDGGYRPAVRILGVGHRVSHNLISDSPHQGIFFDCNNHVIEYNEIYDVTHECKDAGAIYVYGAPRYLLNRGNVMRYNFIHHITEHASPLTTHLLKGIYIDALNGGMTVFGNVLYRNTDRGVYTHGPDTRVSGNVFVDNRISLHHTNRASLLTNPLRIKQWEDNILSRIKYRQPPWSERYPQLRDILEHEKIGWPRDVVIERNINMGGQFLMMPEDLYRGNTVENNMDGVDPLFVNPEKMDFRIRPGSPVYGVAGCEPLPFEKIGLYEDALRASWPVKRTAAGKYYRPGKLESLPPERVQFNPLPFVSKPERYGVKRRPAAIKIDGRLEKKEWAGLDRSKAMVVEKHYSGKNIAGDKSYVWMFYDNEALYIAVENMPNPFREGMHQREKKLAGVLNELAIEGIYIRHTWWWPGDIGTGPVYIFWGSSTGNLEVKNNFGMPAAIIERVKKGIEYAAVEIDREDYNCTAEWKIPFSVLNIRSGIPDGLKFNIGAAKRGGWFVWVPTGASVWRIDNAGILEFIE